MSIGISQRGARGGAVHTQVLELSFAGGQSSDNFAQRPCSSQVAKQERDELAPTGHSLRVLLGLMLPNCALENTSRNESQNLTENAAYSWHGRVILSSWSLALPTLPWIARPASALPPSGHLSSRQSFWTVV